MVARDAVERPNAAFEFELTRGSLLNEILKSRTSDKIVPQPLTPPGLTLEVKRLRSALVALAILYGGYAAVLALAPSSRGTPLAYLAAATALNCGLFGFFLHWSASETSWTRWLGFLTASLSVLNPLAHLFLVRDPIQTPHLYFTRSKLCAVIDAAFHSGLDDLTVGLVRHRIPQLAIHRMEIL